MDACARLWCLVCVVFAYAIDATPQNKMVAVARVLRLIIVRVGWVGTALNWQTPIHKKFYWASFGLLADGRL